MVGMAWRPDVRDGLILGDGPGRSRSVNVFQGQYRGQHPGPGNFRKRKVSPMVHSSYPNSRGGRRIWVAAWK